MALKTADSSIRLEDHISLAVKAYKNGHFKSIKQQQQYMMSHIPL
jgi:hypothetical protein